MISLTVIFCMTLNPTMCRVLPYGHDDYSPITSLEDCMKGGAMSGMSFVMENADWFVKGFRCKEEPEQQTAFKSWLDHQTVVPDAR